MKRGFMNTEIQKEISYEIPQDLSPQILKNGTPIFLAYGCVVLEHTTPKSFVYTGVNLKTNKTLMLNRRTHPLTLKGVENLVTKLSNSSIAGYSKYFIDRPFGEQISYVKCKQILLHIFHEILPKHGFSIRNEQISLTEHMLESILNRKVSLAEAEVGTGKTLAYLLATVLAKRGRLNVSSAFHTGKSNRITDKPIIIATSSIALQKAIIEEYIPKLSKILLEEGIIKTPISVAMRKGREHYICERDLKHYLSYEKNHTTRETLNAILDPRTGIDLGEIDGISDYIKRKICVPSRCDKNCSYIDDCAYLHFRNAIGSIEIDIQVCNHNYLLADVLNRSRGHKPLLPDYQSIIIDEAHKFLSASRSMYGKSLSSLSVAHIKKHIHELDFVDIGHGLYPREQSIKLFSESRRLFKQLMSNRRFDPVADSETSTLSVEIDKVSLRHLKNMKMIVTGLIDYLSDKPTRNSNNALDIKVLWELEQLQITITHLLNHKRLVCWLETSNQKATITNVAETLLCTLPKNLDSKLYRNL